MSKSAALVASERKVAQLEAALAVASVAATKSRLPSASFCRALVNASTMEQRKAFMSRFDAKYPSRMDVESWIEEIRESLGLV